MKRITIILITALILASCGVIPKQQELQVRHEAKVLRPKPDPKKKRQALTITVVVALLWYGLYQGSNPNPE